MSAKAKTVKHDTAATAEREANVPEHFLNRELSLLEFNHRVLEAHEVESVRREDHRELIDSLVRDFRAGVWRP